MKTLTLPSSTPPFSSILLLSFPLLFWYWDSPIVHWVKTHYINENDPGFLILLPPLLQCKAYRPVLLHPVHTVLRTEALFMLGKHSSAQKCFLNFIFKLTYYGSIDFILYDFADVLSTVAFLAAPLWFSKYTVLSSMSRHGVTAALLVWMLYLLTHFIALLRDF